MKLLALGYMEIDAEAVKTAASAFISEAEEVLESLVVYEIERVTKIVVERNELRKTFRGRWKDYWTYSTKYDEYVRQSEPERVRKRTSDRWDGHKYIDQCKQLIEAADIAKASGNNKLLIATEKTWVFTPGFAEAELNYTWRYY